MDVMLTTLNILNYYKQNPGCDPNMYEFAGSSENLVTFLKENAPNKGTHPTKLIDKKLYPTANLAYESFQTLNNVNNFQNQQDSPLKQKLGGVALYIAQKQGEVRNKQIKSFTYDNETEMGLILELDKTLPNNEFLEKGVST